MLYGLYSIKNNIGIPKYKQIVLSIENAIKKGNLNRGTLLPFINSIIKEYQISRDTVFAAYNNLKARGIIHFAGKGCYIKNENIGLSQKIFLLFDELNAFQRN